MDNIIKQDNIKENKAEAQTVEEMYEEHDLSECNIFVGGFINFGVYEDLITDKEMTKEERLASEKNVYSITAQKLSITNQSCILDVACGGGLGTILINDLFHPLSITGIDFPQQIKRCEINLGKSSAGNQNVNNVSFVNGSATEIPFESDIFDGITCVGGLIYFKEYAEFFKESYRVLKAGGILSIASYLGLEKDSNTKLKLLIPPIQNEFEFVHFIDDIKKDIESFGFKVTFESLGHKVFEGFNKWIRQTEYKGTWSENWLKSYKDGLIDYFIIVANK